MRTLVIFIAGILLCGILNAQVVEKLWETDTIFDVPESVLYDDSIIYVSNVKGSPLDKDGEGYIAKLNAVGELIEKEWVSGLDAPKGMGIDGDYLFVTNITEVVVINRFSGEIVNKLPAVESQFMNDICTTDKGVHFASDLFTNSIYFFTKDTCGLYIQDERFERVNGLYYGDDAFLYAGTNDTVYRINIVESKVESFIQNTGPIDGLERVNSKQFVISDWKGKVQLVSKNAPNIELLNFSAKEYNAADIDFSTKENIIFIPTFFGNTVAAYQLIE